MLLAERTVSVIEFRRERVLCGGGTEKNSQRGLGNEKDRHDKADGVGRGHLTQGFARVVKESGFILRAMGSQRRLLS